MKTHDETIQINDGHYLEIVDRISMKIWEIDVGIYEHVVSKQHAELRSKLDEALTALAEAYQIAGKLMFYNT